MERARHTVEDIKFVAGQGEVSESEAMVCKEGRANTSDKKRNLNMLEKRHLIEEFDPLVYKVLHEWQVSYRHLAFEDYAQELRMHLLLLADRFQGDLFGQDRYRFTKYAHQGLAWYLIDLLRKDRYRQHASLEGLSQAGHLVMGDSQSSLAGGDLSVLDRVTARLLRQSGQESQADLGSVMSSALRGPGEESQVFLLAFWQEADKVLDDHEWVLLKGLCQQDRSMSDLASDLGISRKTLYQRKKRLQVKVRQILDKLS